jgi:hypothetical protein
MGKKATAISWSAFISGGPIRRIRGEQRTAQLVHQFNLLLRDQAGSRRGMRRGSRCEGQGRRIRREDQALRQERSERPRTAAGAARSAGGGGGGQDEDRVGATDQSPFTNYSSGCVASSHTVASGGSVIMAEHGCPCHESCSVHMPPMFPTLLPPYTAASVLRISL